MYSGVGQSADLYRQDFASVENVYLPVYQFAVILGVWSALWSYKLGRRSD